MATTHLPVLHGFFNPSLRIIQPGRQFASECAPQLTVLSQFVWQNTPFVWVWFISHLNSYRLQINREHGSRSLSCAMPSLPNDRRTPHKRLMDALPSMTMLP